MSARSYVVRGKDECGNPVQAEDRDLVATADARRRMVQMRIVDITPVFAVAEDGTETPLPSYEEALAEIEAAHVALDPIVSRRDAMADPPLLLAVRCATAAKIVDEKQARCEQLYAEAIAGNVERGEA